MKLGRQIEHEFVGFIPSERDEGKIYISIEYATAVHNCFCGCGIKVVTPISPTGWQLGFDGESVTLYPSIGNWGSACRSHYWIRRNRVVWGETMSRRQIEHGRSRDIAAREAYYALSSNEVTSLASQEGKMQAKKEGLWTRLARQLWPDGHR